WQNDPSESNAANRQDRRSGRRPRCARSAGAERSSIRRALRPSEYRRTAANAWAKTMSLTACPTHVEPLAPGAENRLSDATRVDFEQAADPRVHGGTAARHLRLMLANSEVCVPRRKRARRTRHA